MVAVLVHALFAASEVAYVVRESIWMAIDMFSLFRMSSIDPNTERIDASVADRSSTMIKLHSTTRTDVAKPHELLSLIRE